MLKRSCVLASLAVGAFIVPFQSASAAPQAYIIDNKHTVVGFEVAHLMISSVEGKFDVFGGDFMFDPTDFTQTTLNAWADTTSVDTGEVDRDKHLRGPDFFEADTYPKMTFVSKTAQKTGDKTFKLNGEMTMHGITRPTTFDVTYKGEVQMPYGTVQAFKATTTVNRKDFGMNFSKMSNSVVLVGDEVTITINVEGIPKPAATAQAPAAAPTSAAAAPAPSAQPAK
jgi:polyisoprenoid-binding protein YceI